MQLKSPPNPFPDTFCGMRLGPLTLPSNLFLSPLAGYTNLPFRLTVRELGGLGVATTDLVNARSLLEKETLDEKDLANLIGAPADARSRTAAE